jgi:hypothetical protein
MKFEVDVSKRYALVLLGLAFVLAGIFIVYAAAVDTKVNHGPDQIDWNLPINGPIKGNMNANSDVWIQGGESTAAGNNRNLAIRGEKSSDRLILNFQGEYAGGTRIDGAVQATGDVSVDGSINLGGVARTTWPGEATIYSKTCSTGSGGGVCTASCNAGDSVVGGGGDKLRVDGNLDARSLPSTDGTGWVCSLGSSGNCYARCLSNQ